MDIQIIQAVLRVFDEYGDHIRFDIERFEKAINDEVPSLLDECFLVVQGMKYGLLEMMTFNPDLKRKDYVQYVITQMKMSEDEALFTVVVFENIKKEMGLYFEMMGMDSLLKQAQDNQNMDQLYLLGKSYYEGFGTEVDYAKAFEIFQYLDSCGDERVAYYLGYMYEYGYGIEQDIEKALKYYTSGEDSRCFERLGQLYMTGQHINKDNQMALYYFSMSQEDQAYFYKGLLLEELGDYSGATISYLEGAKLYQCDCLYKIGLCFYRGIGIELDQKQAFEYFTYAYYCLHGNSAYYLSMMYFDGIVVKKSIKKALFYLKQAAQLYSLDACLLLARFYENGQYVEKNPHKASIYYYQAQDIRKKL